MQIGQMVDEPLKIIIHSPSGRGKTALATTLGSCAQLIDADKGTETCRKLMDKFRPERLLVDVLSCPEIDPTRDAKCFSQAKDYILAISSAIGAKKYPFKVLIIDSFTTIADGALRYVLKNNNRLTRPLTVKDGGVTQPEWGLMINEVENFILILRGLPIHVIVLAHSVPTDINGLVRHEISIPTQKLPPRIPNYFDEIWYLENIETGGGNVDRVMRTVESPTFLAKSRSGLPDKTKTDLGMKEIFKRLGRDL